MTAEATTPVPLSTPPSGLTSGPLPPRVRASDAEREDTVARLHAALGEGRLDLAETEERSAVAYAAQFRDELPPLLADLPGGAAPAATGGPPTWGEVWTTAVWRARLTLLGAGDRPTAAQRRTAAVLTALAVVWTIACAFLGAGLVG